ncbi:MAG TPA: aldolase, partial [Pengzhenrongella sp.]
FDAALARVLKAAQAAGIVAGIHTANGEITAQRIAQGFTFVSVASDLTHLEQVAAAHLKTALGGNA